MVKFAKFSALAAFAAALAMFGIVLSASATHVQPTLISGNPSCAGDLKIEPVTSGDFGPVNITVNGSFFDFTTDSGFTVSAVTVKGGPDANLYVYDPPTTGDTGLHAPINPKNGKPYGLSHLCFSIDEKTPPPPTTTTPDPKPTSPTPDPKP